MSNPAERLRRARIAKGYATAADAARAFGWPEVTYQAHGNGTRGIRPDVADKYARALGTTAAELLGIRGQVVDHIDEVGVVAHAQVGVWRDKLLDGKQPASRHLGIAVPRVASGCAVVKFAVEIRDRSVDRLLPEGTFAICLPVTGIDDTKLTIGALVFVERERGGLIEYTVRRVSAKTADHVCVSCYSTDPRFSDVLHVPARREGELITIRWRVGANYAPLNGDA